MAITKVLAFELDSVLFFELLGPLKLHEAVTTEDPSTVNSVGHIAVMYSGAVTIECRNSEVMTPEDSSMETSS